MDDYIFKRFNIANLASLGRIIMGDNDFLILCHIRPDPDMIGGALALFEVLRMLGKNVKILCEDYPNPLYSFLEPYKYAEKLEPDISSYVTHGCNVIFLDTGSPYWDYYPEWKNLFQANHCRIWNIDHHGDNSSYADINLLDSKSCAVCMLLTLVFKFFDILWTPDIARSLMMGIISDTGSLTHGYITPDTYRVVSFLFSQGATIEAISKNFTVYPVGKLKLWGEILRRLTWTKGQGVFSYICLKDLELTGCNEDDLSGDIMNTYMAGVKGSRYAIFAKEKAPLDIKVSLRTIKDDVNVQEMAAKFGGGGHIKASGFTLKLPVDEALPLLSANL